MSDQIFDLDLRRPKTTADALSIYEAFSQEIVRDDENSALMATAWLFEDLCDERGLDPIDALCQLLDLERPQMEDEEDEIDLDDFVVVELGLDDLGGFLAGIFD